MLDIGHYSENEARIIFRQIVAGVGYLHSKGIAHRDLKLENLLMAKRGDIMGVKIADFGLAKGQAATSLSTICGTPQYVAPEVIAKGAKSGFHSYKLSCDVWSCGVILFVLLGGYPPFYDESEPRLFDKIRWVWWGRRGLRCADLHHPQAAADPHQPMRPWQAGRILVQRPCVGADQ